eukprot:CAMPEP_0117693770 /NCGR_PEP_ID=MMETSP0804-20121206/27067_1 /TAXON_ID=1074897 /ORGANISM="Tetraselmis astigmatica, Strain CCMP880" /LENGTH=45 /DNA_ID= /DNA_START= /DNA_END= /DNA_ORIENTATION=
MAMPAMPTVLRPGAAAWDLSKCVNGAAAGGRGMSTAGAASLCLGT